MTVLACGISLHFTPFVTLYVLPHYSTIHCLLVDCGLLRHIIEIISEETASAATESSEEEAKAIRTKSLIAGSRRPIVGHVISIAQSIVGAMQPQRGEGESVDISQDVSSDHDLDCSHNLDHEEHPTLVKSVLVEAGICEEWNSFVHMGLQKVMDKQSSYGNMDNNDTSVDSGKLSQMEAALEALALQDNAWLKHCDDDVQNNVFDDDDDSDDDDNSDDEDDYHNYGHSNFSSQIKVTAVVKDVVSPDRNMMVDFEDDEFEIGDQFAKFDSSTNDQNFADFGSSSASPSFAANFDNDAPPFTANFEDASASFAANFDNVPDADFGADFSSPQFEPTASFEANFDSVQGGEDLFADFNSETSGGAKSDPFFSTVTGGTDIGGDEETKDDDLREDEDDFNRSSCSTEAVPLAEEGKEEAKSEGDAASSSSDSSSDAVTEVSLE